MTDRDRAQLVLLAAAVVAVAFVPIVAAYLQLGYHADVRASGDVTDPVGAADRALTRRLRPATRDVARRYAWDERAAAAEAVRSRLRPSLDALDGPRVDGRLVRLSADPAAASRVATTDCPRGRGRDFGPCRALGAVVVQERANRTQVLAVVYDVRVDGPSGRTRATLVVRR